MTPPGRVQWPLTAAVLSLCLVCLPFRAMCEEPGQRQRVRLFGTLEFRTSLKTLPRWQRVLERAGDQMQRLVDWRGEGRPPGIRRWQAMLAAARTLPEMAVLERVNRFFNRWPYRLDAEIYGQADYWATPEEFMASSGDCEDYGIAKYFSLRQLGFRPSQLRLVVVQDRIRGIGHAVLAVYLAEEVYVLDNVTDQVLPHSKYRHYLPQYSVNEIHGWAHLPAGKAPASAQRRTRDLDPLGNDP